MIRACVIGAALACAFALEACAAPAPPPPPPAEQPIKAAPSTPVEREAEPGLAAPDKAKDRTGG